jgi:gluconate 2-dehydrogenase alpha chain
MQPARVADPVDAVIVGVGWAGGIIASELTKAGMTVVGLERGPLREPSDSAYVEKHDELRFTVRQDLLQDTALETWTFRHHARETALPIRYAGAFTPATGVGGSSGHYGSLTSRLAPWEFEIRSRTVTRYGESAIPDGSTIQDWGITYDELEPYYDRMEQAIGVSGAAGNVGGVVNDGGNPFEGARSGDFPLPPVQAAAGVAFIDGVCRSLGWHPCPTPSAILSRDYTNPDGVSRAACTYCGDCAFYLCAVGAKGDSRVAVLPVALQSGRFDLRPGSYVVKVLHDGERATGVLYHDAAGELVEQPAGVVILSAYAFNNTRLLLLSEMGQPYEPVSGQGLIGKNYAYQAMVLGTGFFKDRRFKSFMGSGGGLMLDDFTNDNFDHTGLGFIGGGTFICMPSHRAIGSPLPPGTPRWGSEWKRAMSEWYDRSLSVVANGHSLSYRTNYLDLDPTYTDAWGQPLIRITFDWRENERRVARFLADRMRDLLSAAKADFQTIRGLDEHFDVARYQSTHNTGGAIMGSDPRSSVVNSFLQMWDYENVWVVGGSAFPQNGTPGPTGTIGALAYRAAEGIVNFHKKPGPLVDAP